MRTGAGSHFIFFYSSEFAVLGRSSRVIISGDMKMLIQILLVALLAGCVSTYHPVYVSSEGDYYIAERSNSGTYYGSSYAIYTDIGLNPWWVGGYPAQTFAYYSPNYYPYFFSIWYPPGYYPHYGYYRGNWHAYSPHMYCTNHYHQHRGLNAPGRNPVLPPTAYNGLVVTPEVWKSVDRVKADRDLMISGGAGQKAAVAGRSVSSYARSPARYPVSAPQMSSARSSGISRVSTRSVTASRGKSLTHRSVPLDRQ
jgi:hypothetical protein